LKVGILALQGAVAPHAEKITRLGATPVLVKKPEHLDSLAGLLLPGGETTAMLKLAGLNGLWDPLCRFVREKPSFGVCAGLILLAREVTHPAQASLGLLDVCVERNGFGRQIDSFIGAQMPTQEWMDAQPIEGVFIRAPRMTQVGERAKVLLTWNAEPTFVQQGHTLGASFHPELTESDKIHAYFLNLCKDAHHG